LDQALQSLHLVKAQWASLPVSELVSIVDQIHNDLHSVEQRWVAAGMAAKGSLPQTMAEGEEWFALSVMYRYLRYLRKTLVDIQQNGSPRLPGKLCWKAAGEFHIDLVPGSWQDRLALLGIRAEAWVVDRFKGDLPAMGAAYKHPPEGKVALVLGAGNVASLPAGDFLHKLFVERQVVLFKINPVNAYLADLIAEGFRALVEPGYLRIVQGGAEVGQYLSQHLLVDEIHLTGSDRTYEAIVFGQGDEGRERKRRNEPVHAKRVTAELGSVSPVIIVPGPWSQRDIRAQAAKYATGLVANAGFNCITPRLFIQSAQWDERSAFNQAVSSYLAKIETRKAYYPGAKELHAQFAGAHPEAEQSGQPSADQLPWTFVPGVDSREDDFCFRKEAFFGLFAETALDESDPIAFLKQAVQFANERLWGNLCATIVIHPQQLQDPLVAAAVNQAIADLRYGSVIVNHWGALAYYLAITPWGAIPGNQPADIQSGIGKVHNPLMFDEPIKSVLWAPFISIPDPYRADAKRSYRYYRQDTRYQHTPSIVNLAKLLWAAVRS
jgi:acyl-CoA reductase-like NAD-dependent aldehyde dehydrogenase